MQYFGAILVGLVVLFILISLYKEIFGVTFTFFIAILVLGLFGVLTPSEILAGFGNEQIAVIIMLLLLGDAIRRTSVVEIFFERIFPRNAGNKGFLLRMSLWVSTFSSFLNNTPLVAVMMPYVHQWSARNNISSSKLLMPLSFATILGGCITLIGTSTNLIVNGMVIDQKIIPGMEPLGMFDFFWVGFPMLIIGIAYLYFFSFRLLPDNNASINEISPQERRYNFEGEVHKNSRYIGKTLGEMELLDLKKMFVYEILRGEELITNTDDNTIIESGDILHITSCNHHVVECLAEGADIRLPSVGMMSKLGHTQVIEVVISHNSSLVSKAIGKINFRALYEAVPLGIHRNGETMSGNIEDVILRAGDVVLLLVENNFFKRIASEQEFYLLSRVQELRKQSNYKVYTLFGGTLLAILLAAINLVPLFMGLLVVLVTITLLNVVSPKDLPKGIDYSLAAVIALSLALGTAMIKTGVADWIATFVVKIFIPMGTIAVLLGIYAITTVLAAYITNKAAVAIIFPISISAAKMLAVNPEPFALVVAFAAAANFMTPIGYQTNLMVYGPGGYTFKDFFRFGFPLTVIYMIVTVIMLNIVYF